MGGEGGKGGRGGNGGRVDMGYAVCDRGLAWWYTRKSDNNEIIEHILDVIC